MLPDGSKLVQTPIEDELKDSYLTYSMSVIVSRAIPDVRDGLKPSQRRILVAMNDLGIGPHAQRVKCAKISGDASGNYHPHGEAIIYPTLVRMAQDWNMRHVLVDKQGNFGSIAGLPPAAMRYTEARLSGMAMAMLEDLNLDTVDFIPTYDETRMEPTVLPAKAPNLLVNGANGIAVGMATSIPPHNLGEVCDAAIAVIDDPDVSPFALLRICPGPDYPTGGIICGTRGIRRAYLQGRGSIIVRARTIIESNGKRNRIIVTEIPYQQARDDIEKRIAENVQEGRIVGVSTIRNESDLKEPVRLVLELKKDADPNVVLNQLYRFTPLQSTLSIILLALVDGKPRVLTFKELIVEFLRHRKNVIRRRTTFLLNKALKRQHTVEGLLIAHANIDEVIRTIRESSTQFEAKQRLMKIECPAALLQRALGAGFESFQKARGVKESYTLSPVQADAILKMTLGQLVNLEQKKLGDEYNTLLDDINEYNRILSDERNILEIVRNDLIEIKNKFADARRTEILQDELDDVIDEDLINEEAMVVSISNNGYVKRTPLDEYRAQRRGGKGVKGAKVDDEDPVRHLFVASTHAYLLFFTNKGKVYWQKVYNLPQAARDGKGRNLVNVLSLAPGERVANCLPVRDFNQEDAYLVMATRDGLIKKTKLSSFSRPLKRGIIAIRLRGGAEPNEPEETTEEVENTINYLDDAPIEDAKPQETQTVEEEFIDSPDRDALVAVSICREGDEIFLSTASGRSIRFRQSDVRVMGRNASGVRGIRLRGEDVVVAMEIARPDAYLFAVCENGFGKRTVISSNSASTVDSDEDALDDDVPTSDDSENDVEENEEGAVTKITYPTKHRGGMGVLDVKTGKRNGLVVDVLCVEDGDEVMTITASGKIQRFSVDDIRSCGRNSMGVRIMRLDPGDRIVAANRVPRDEVASSGKAIVGVSTQALRDDSADNLDDVDDEEQIQDVTEQENLNDVQDNDEQVEN
ncbi:MAG: DNA topoisomerase (ATP-hydrolyzing) subunit A [Planctomycetia bacterium]|nr:DNA topoisomerase (ATP-hydrolyzing) subunit A [Planctomycetia bacterium]